MSVGLSTGLRRMVWYYSVSSGRSSFCPPFSLLTVQQDSNTLMYVVAMTDLNLAIIDASIG